MKLIDANLLLYAVDERSPRHQAANEWLENTMSGRETIALAWTALLAFTRLATNPAVFENPLSSDEAFDYVDSWLDQPCVTVVQPTDRHAVVMRELLSALGSAGNLVSDAHLAALSIEHGAELCSCDADFSRFPGLQWLDPLSG